MVMRLFAALVVSLALCGGVARGETFPPPGLQNPITGLVGLNGLTAISGTDLAGGGNVCIGVEGTCDNIASGTESTYVGDRAGARNTGGGNAAFGHNALGIGGGCTTFASNNNAAFGADALRDICNTGGQGSHTAIGAWALKNFGVGNTSPNGGGMTAVGFKSMWLNNNNNSGNNSTAIGIQSCAGAGSDGSPTGSFRGLTCLGANTGGALTGATNSTLIGRSVGNTTFASGSGVILIGSSNVTVDTPAGNTSNYINIENVLTWTGTGTPSTSVPTIHGLPVLPDVTTGTPAASLCLDASNNVIKKTTTGSCV